VLERIRRSGPVSRAQIARETGLSKPTVSQALSTLERARLVREAGRTSGGKGPTALLYELNPAAGWVIGIDVGREYVRAAAADLTGKIVAQRRQAARARSARTLITTIGAVARAAAESAGIGWRRVTVAAVGSPGVFGSAGHPLLAHNLPGWTREGLLDEIRQRLDLAMLFITHDLRVAAQVCDRVAVMTRGRIVEYGTAAQVFADPRDDYTKSLLAAAPGRHFAFGAA